MRGRGGGGNVQMRVTQTVDDQGHVHVTQQMMMTGDGDDDDDDEMPEELKRLLGLTEDMHNKATGKKKVERTEESKDDIMKRLNKLSEEIGERKDTSRYEKVDNKKGRIIYIAAAGLIFVTFVVISMFLTCKS